MSTPPAPLAALVGIAADDLSALIAELAAAEMTVACAESLTGGLLAALLTEVPGSSAVVRGGLVVYATDLKHTLAGVDRVLLDERGPVDPDVAIALARGVRTACGAAIGIGLTGVAGPDQQDGVAVGTWFVALAGAPPGGTYIEDLTAHFPGESRDDPTTRPDIRNAAVRAAVALLSGLIKR